MFPEPSNILARIDATSALFHSIFMDNTTALTECLKNKLVNTKTTNDNGLKPLQFAVGNSREKCIDTLLGQYKVDPNIKDGNGMTPIHWLAARPINFGLSGNLEQQLNQLVYYCQSCLNHLRIAQKLIDAGAKVDLTNTMGQTAAEMAYSSGRFYLTSFLNKPDELSWAQQYTENLKIFSPEQVKHIVVQLADGIKDAKVSQDDIDQLTLTRDSFKNCDAITQSTVIYLFEEAKAFVKHQLEMAAMPASCYSR